MNFFFYTVYSTVARGPSRLGFYGSVYSRKLEYGIDIGGTIFEYLGRSFIFEVQGPWSSVFEFLQIRSSGRCLKYYLKLAGSMSQFYRAE